VDSSRPAPPSENRDPAASDGFDRWCRDALYSASVIEATAILDRYCDHQLQAVYRTLELGSLLREPSGAAEVAARLRLVDSAEITMHALLYRLARRTPFVEMVGQGLDARFVHRADPPDPGPELAALRERMAGLGSAYCVSLDFLDFGVEHFERSLRDDPDFMDRMLSGREGTFAELWHAATNLDPLQDLHGAMGAEAITRHGWGGVILELGGGTGNGIRHLLQRLGTEDALARVGHYVFTDISVRFLMKTRAEVKRSWPGVNCSWTFADLNQPLRGFRIPEHIDLVYAVNAAHVARDMPAFLRQCHEVLAPGGRVVFAERVRIDPYEMAPRELTLNLSVYHRGAALRSEARPMHCYLSPGGWSTLLREAGFEPELLPDLDGMAEHFPQQYAAVVVGHKPA
ncbi:MAG: class I SAM-dependent methyltransferase, partial [Myxococcales bacterium]|nr:class I SAM-dependent methyltransferase [Myxococcales bacterium]